MASSLNNPGRDSPDHPANAPAWLDWMAKLMGGVSRQTYAATLPPDRFYCVLDELPLHLIPRRVLRSTHIHDHRPLFLNPECIVCPEGQLPDELAAQQELLSGFALQGTIAWVRDSAAGSMLPFWLGPELEKELRNLDHDEPASARLQNGVRTLLVSAGILIPQGHAGRRRQEWEEAVGKSGPIFREKGYAPLSDLIHPFHIAALRRYYRHRIRTGAIHLGDGQSPRRYVAYNDPVARFFHQQIAAKLSAVAGQALKPSYVYLASYLSGAELKKHTDREQCDFSVTLCLDFSPEPALETPWPIQLDTPKGTVTVYQALGDALAYRGTRLPHYRGKLSDGQTSTSIFFHYVSEDFAGSLD